jgi:hypothetical protein
MIKDCKTKITNLKISKGKETHKGVLFLKIIIFFIVSLIKIIDRIKRCLAYKLKSYKTYDPK